MIDVTVILGDPRLGDQTKVGAAFSAEDLESVLRMKAALAMLEGYRFTFLDDHATLAQSLLAAPPAFVLNLCDTGLRNDAAMELHVPALLETIGVPCTGAGPVSMVRCYDKSLVRAAALGLGVPVPDERFVPGCDPSVPLEVAYPVIVKPNLGDGSVGITQDSITHDEAGARACLRRLRAQWPGRDALVQEFLTGDEFGICLIGNTRAGFRVLPPLVVDYSELDPKLPRLLGYESKTLPDSPYWKQVRYRRAELDQEELDRLVHHAERLFDRLACRDYARFDFRRDAAGVIKLIEVNPNCAWCWDGKMMLMAGFDGRTETDVFRWILEAARARYT